MQHQNYQQDQNYQSKLTYDILEANFAFHKYEEMRSNQKDVFVIMGQDGIVWVFELPTGSGKTDIGGTFLKALESIGLRGALFYTAPTKALVSQFKSFYPEAKLVYGRNEYPCLYYYDRGRQVNAADSPCYLLFCPHRVSQDNGKTIGGEAAPCPYLQAKWEASQGGLVVCTTAFFLVNKVYQNWPEKISGLVADEAHKWAHVARSVFQYDITDYHLKRVIKMLKPIDAEQADRVHFFLETLAGIVRLKPARRPTLLEPHEIRALILALNKIRLEEVEDKVRAAVSAGRIDAVEEQEDLKALETIGKNVKQYIRSLRFAVGTETRNPLNYVFAFCRKRLGKRERAKYILCIRNHYVAPLNRKSLEDVEYLLSYSATIGDPKVFGIETGMQYPFWAFPSEFPAANARVFLPIDTPNLAFKPEETIASRKHQALTMVAEAVAEFKKAGHRSLVVTVSNKEREDFIELCKQFNLEAVSYGDGVKPKDAVVTFTLRQGDVLVGTAANYSHGINLPKQLAPVIFFLRPSYPKPDEPATQFEARRFGSERWKLWNWRVMIEALQVRGRNIRSDVDIGVAFFISQQFKRFLEASLPDWLLGAYHDDKPMADFVEEAKELLKE